MRAFREARGFTQEELAALLDVTATTIHRWETGLRVPNRTKQRVIAERTGIKPNELVGYELREAAE